jgi:hypothetical protein
MDINDVWLSRIGTFVTIAGAIGSLWGWKKSRGAATEAQKVLSKIDHQRNIREMSNLHVELSKTLKSLRAIGFGSNVEKLRGINIDTIISVVEDFIEMFANQALKPETIEKLNFDANKFCDEIRDNISELSDAKKPTEKLKIGRTLYTKISAIQPQISLISDNLTYSIQR